jgi:hypothetical protein
MTNYDNVLALRDVAIQHGYIFNSGEADIDGLVLAIADGKVATIQINENDRRNVVKWLNSQLKGMEDSDLRNAVKQVKDQLRAAMQREKMF